MRDKYHRGTVVSRSRERRARGRMSARLLGHPPPYGPNTVESVGAEQREIHISKDSRSPTRSAAPRWAVRDNPKNCSDWPLNYRYVRQISHFASTSLSLSLPLPLPLPLPPSLSPIPSFIRPFVYSPNVRLSFIIFHFFPAPKH